MCPDCETDKELTPENFHWRRPGLLRVDCCKLCRNARHRASHAENRTERNVRNREYRRRHKADDARRSREYRSRHPERRRRSALAYHYRNKQKATERQRARRAKEVKTPRNRLNDAMRAGIYSSLRGKKANRAWQVLAGYSIEMLVAHLERQFKRGMTWDNYGSGWHVDHVRPVSSFSFSSAKDADFRDCWGLANLRPLWSRENLSKSGKRIFLI